MRLSIEGSRPAIKLPELRVVTPIRPPGGRGARIVDQPGEPWYTPRFPDQSCGHGDPVTQDPPQVAVGVGTNAR